MLGLASPGTTNKTYRLQVFSSRGARTTRKQNRRLSPRDVIKFLWAPAQPRLHQLGYLLPIMDSSPKAAPAVESQIFITPSSPHISPEPWLREPDPSPSRRRQRLYTVMASNTPN